MHTHQALRWNRLSPCKLDAAISSTACRCQGLCYVRKVFIRGISRSQAGRIFDLLFAHAPPCERSHDRAPNDWCLLSDMCTSVIRMRFVSASIWSASLAVAFFILEQRMLDKPKFHTSATKFSKSLMFSCLFLSVILQVIMHVWSTQVCGIYDYLKL